MPRIIRIINLDKEFVYKTSRSGGKGGQNVNKVSSKVELLFDVLNSDLLTDEQRKLILEKCKNHINNQGVLSVVVQTNRSQLKNKEKAIEKFYKMLSAAFVIPKKRKATKLSKAVKEKRLKSKRIIAEKKMNRRAPDF